MKAGRVCIYIVTALSLLTTSCRKDPPLWEIKNLNDGKISVVGHGGMGIKSMLPLNSLASINACVKTGVNGVEVDLRLSADDTFFLFHDNAMEHSTACSGSIENMPGAEIGRCRYKSFQGEHAVLSAKEMVERELPEDFLFVFDCKLNTYKDSLSLRHFAEELTVFVENHGIEQVSMIESSSLEFLEMARELMPESRLYFYCQQASVAFEQEKPFVFNGITMNMDQLTAAQIEQAHKLGLRVTLFGADTERKNVEAILMNPDNIQTDLPAHLAKIYVNKEN